MIFRFIIWIVLIAMIAITGYALYENIPHSPVQLSTAEFSEDSSKTIDFGTTPVFEENLRFDHNKITYYIKDSCSTSRISRMEEAFKIIEEEVRVISFLKKDGDDADIIIYCSDESINVGDNLYAAGEGGPSRIIKLGKYNIIEKGTIYLYKESKCEYPNVELHELLHVFGFDHSDNPDSIMYNTSNCNQKMSNEIVRILEQLYSIKPLPDAVITNLSAVKKGKYLDFNITVVNQGFKAFSNLSLTIFSDGREVDTLYLDKIERGFARSLKTTNLKLFSSSSDAIEFYVDYENAFEELDENNNYIKMRTS